MKCPLVSAIIPVYNCERYLGEAIESVLAQTYQPIEIIVVNDGSTDNTEKIAENYSDNIKYYYQENGGIGPARNKGIKNSKGDYLTFLDADDLWVKDKLEKQMVTIKHDKSIDLIYGYVEQFLSPEIFDELKFKYKCPDEPMPGRLASTLLISKENFLAVGYFSTEMSVGVDIDWHLRAKEKNFKMFTLKDTLLKRRIHKTNTGIVNKTKHTNYVRYLKESLDRRRKNSV